MAEAHHVSNGKAGRVLSAADLAHYERHGFVLVRSVVPQSLLDRCRQRFRELCTDPAQDPSITVMKDLSLLSQEFGQQSVNKIQDFVNDPVLFDYCQLPQLVAIVKDLVGEGSILAMHTMLINKPPDPGTKTSRHPMHQDLHYFPFRPADGIVCAWTAMEPVNRDNGCLVVLPGSHTGRLLPHGYPQWQGGVNKLYHGIVDFDPDKHERLHVVMQPGDTLFFHPLLIHGSGTNTTSGFRKAISCHYANGDVCSYIDVEGTSQADIAQEVALIAKKRLAKLGINANDVEFDFKDLWRIRSREVTGGRGKL